MNVKDLKNSKVEEEISALLVSHGIESDKSDELAKKILELPSMNNIGSPVVDSTPTEADKKRKPGKQLRSLEEAKLFKISAWDWQKRHIL